MSNQPNPWLAQLAENPMEAVDDLLCGVALLPIGLGRASPAHALSAMAVDFPPDAPELRALIDATLCQWLRNRFADPAAHTSPHGGVRRFIREVGEALRIAWDMNLPISIAWVRKEIAALQAWDVENRVDDTFCLTRALDWFAA